MRKNTRKNIRWYVKILSLLFLILWPISQAWGCFSVVVGKDASASGCVIMAHNEDDSPPVVVNHHKMDRKRYQPDDMVVLRNGGRLEQVLQTWAYIWSEMPGLTFSDSYLNEWGVCVASDNCPSREDQPELADGGINYMLRRLVAERAATSRQGVHLAGELVEKFGYDASGRTYVICDPNEGWFFCVVNGKHWLAARVPDDEVAMVSNTYTVHEIDLSDTMNFLASEDIIDYAISRGWYNPDKDGKFDFAAVYANPDVAASENNICRQWAGLNLVAADAVPYDQYLPFSVKPVKKLDVTDVMHILRNHYEGTDYYEVSPENGSPHDAGVHTICNGTTQTAFVAELRGGMPSDVGLVYWVCLGSPCTSFFVPHYFGIEDFYRGYQTMDEVPTAEYYNKKVMGPFMPDTLNAFWTSINFRNKVHAHFINLYPLVQDALIDYERRALALKKSVEETALGLFPDYKDAALQMLEEFSRGLYKETFREMSRIPKKR
jgi:dipeptidase